MKYFLFVHFTIFILLYFYIIFAIRYKEKKENLEKININKNSLFLISFLWEILLLLWTLITTLRIILKTKRFLDKKRLK